MLLIKGSLLFSLNLELFESPSDTKVYNPYKRNYEFFIIEEKCYIQRFKIDSLYTDENNLLIYIIRNPDNEILIYETEETLNFKIRSKIYFLEIENAYAYYLKKLLVVGRKLYTLSVNHHSLRYDGQVNEHIIEEINKDENNKIIFTIKYSYIETGEPIYLEEGETTYDFIVRERTFYKKIEEHELVFEIKRYEYFLNMDDAYYYYYSTITSTF